jgi:acylphosphatase
MSPPDDSTTAEIYVEGKRKMVDGFVRWCKKGNVGLSQVVTVTEVIEADPTGLYDAFYCKTH